jgi:hypothetical protein
LNFVRQPNEVCDHCKREGIEHMQKPKQNDVVTSMLNQAQRHIQSSAELSEIGLFDDARCHRQAADALMREVLGGNKQAKRVVRWR